MSNNPISKRVHLWETRQEEPQPKEDEHFHITLIAPNITVLPVIVSNESVAMSEWTKMIKMYYDYCGIKVKMWGEKMAVFENGASVRWFKCHHDCLERVNARVELRL
jgi:hypothetical protein